MSGYIGLLVPANLGQYEKILDSCHKTITKTCNDFAGRWSSDVLDLRFGLLKVIDDTDKEELPYTRDENLIILGDVRLDNREKLIADLCERFPYIDLSYPDSYILLHTYMAWGDACLNQISGDYSFVIWNEVEKTLFCARDHFGIIPFYYAETEEGFIFTNFYSALRAVPGLMTEINDEVLKSYLVAGNGGSFSSTIYKKIKKLPPAHTLIYKKGKLELKRYWVPQLPEKLIRYKNIEEYVAHFNQIFERSVADRLRSNTVASQLSGGMDSSSVTAMAKHVLSKKYAEEHTLQAYNLKYKYLVKENESYFATMIAKHLGIELKQFIAEDYLSKISLTLDDWVPEPVGIPNASPERAMIKDASSASLKIFLTGFGSDILFDYNGRRWLKMLKTKYFFRFFSDLFLFIKIHGRPPGFGLKEFLKRIIKGSSIENNNLPSWLNREYLGREYLQFINKTTSSSQFKGLGLFTNSFWQSILEHGHQGFSENRIKVRHPFFSLELQEFLLALPPYLLYNKYLLRLSMQAFLPMQVISRPKTLLFGGAHFNNLKSSRVMHECMIAIKEDEEFLNDKIDVPALLSVIENPDKLRFIDSRVLISLIFILAWKKKV